MIPDTTLTPVSRTVGEDQLADEMIFSFTGTREVPLASMLDPSYQG